MSQNIFKIYDGRTNFWQWDTFGFIDKINNYKRYKINE